MEKKVQNMTALIMEFTKNFELTICFVLYTQWKLTSLENIAIINTF